MDELIRQAEESAEAPQKAPSRLKSRIFSQLVSLEQAEGPLRTLTELRDAGCQLCVFEHAVALLPSETLNAKNPCNICHARILGENVSNPPIYWPGCPYSRFAGH